MNGAAEKSNRTVRGRGNVDPGIYCPQLDWLLNSAEGLCGARGTMGGVVATLELGGYPGGVPETDIYNDLQVGYGPKLNGRGHVERARRLWCSWRQLAEPTRWIMGLHYSPRPAPGLGRMVEDRDRNGKLIGRSWQAFTRWPAGVSGELGRLAGVALGAFPDKREQLLHACEHPRETGSRAFLDAYIPRVERLVRGAHSGWYLVRRRQTDEWLDSEAKASVVPRVERKKWDRTETEIADANELAPPGDRR
jgi:hypothetical protein